MMDIDGSQGEGGGQIIRSSLALAAVTQQPIRLFNIRAGRKKPGLLRQHLTGVRATAEICGATVSGDALSSGELIFEPSEIRPGDYSFEIGSAGSVCLVAQTVLPALMIADSESTVTISGGTHAQWAPPYDFLRDAFMPQLRKMGPEVQLQLDAYGFYPAGGGQIRMDIHPVEALKPLSLIKPPNQPQVTAIAIVSGLPKRIAERQCQRIASLTGHEMSRFQILEIEGPRGPGNVVMVFLDGAEITEVFTGFGKRGVRAEEVAKQAVDEAMQHLERAVPVGEFLADQLMLPMGLCASQGGDCEFLTGPLSLHSRTHLEILKRFLPIKIDVSPDPKADKVIVRFGGP